ncbi:MAG: cyclic nucleotide-binding domain-containing protein [SAR324 cluster bacterium]|nr:cyclic nucleotide-binding domain-containing protein [SAR324 cluster bacterium]
MTDAEVTPVSKINSDELFESLLSTIAPEVRDKAKEKIIQTLSNFQINYDSLSDIEKNIFDKLKDKRSFDKMPETMLLNLVKNMEVMDYKPKQDILKQNTHSDAIYILLQGRLAVIVDRRLIYEFRRPGDLIGEMSFITKEKVTATITAVEASKLLAISKKILTFIGGEDFYIWTSQIVAEKTIRTQKTLQEQINTLTEEKELMVLEKESLIKEREVLKAKLKMIAIKYQEMTKNKTQEAPHSESSSNGQEQPQSE